MIKYANFGVVSSFSLRYTELCTANTLFFVLSFPFSIPPEDPESHSHTALLYDK